MLKRITFVLLALFAGSRVFAQSVYLNETFSGTTAPEWNFITGMGTGAVLTASDAMPSEQRDIPGEGWLRLTHDLLNQASFVYYTNRIPTAQGLAISFDFAIWTTENRAAADGFVLSIFEPTETPGAGGYGGSLGYAQRTGIEGLNRALVGFGFDAHGNFSSPTEGREGGPGRRRDAIAIRGPMGANRNQGYVYLSGTGSLESFYTQNQQSRTNVTIHSARITIAPDRTVSIAWTDKLGNWEKLIWENCDLPCPEQVMLGFTAGTGGSRANQEIRNLTVTSFSDASLLWDGGSTGDSGWGDAQNWVNDGLPAFGKTADLVFSASGASRLENYLGTARTVRSLVFTTNTLHDVVIRTTTTADGANPAALVFAAEGDGASIMMRAGTTNHVTIGQAGGTIILSNNLFVAHHGTGLLRLGRPLTGTGALTKSGAGSLVLSGANSYAGDTTLLAGALVLDGSGTLGGTANNLYVWGGALDLGGTEQTKQTVQLRGGDISNGVLRVNSRLHYYGGRLNTALTGNGGIDKWESDTTLTLAADNTYQGTTVVRAGTLLVENATGSGTGSARVTVNGNAVIGGQGRVGGDLTLNSGSKFVFSMSGALRVGGAVTFNGLAITDMLGLGETVPSGSYRQIQGGVTTNGLHNLGPQNAVQLAEGKFAYFTVVEGDLGVVITSNPLSAAIDLALYAVANGQVVIELWTVDEEGDGDIVVEAQINGVWVEVGRVPAHEVTGKGSRRYLLRTDLLETDASYRLRVIDEAGTLHLSHGLIPVRAMRMERVRLGLQTIELSFTTEAGRRYVVQSSTNLKDWVNEPIRRLTASGWSDPGDAPFTAEPGLLSQVRAPVNTRKTLFFRAVLVAED